MDWLERRLDAMKNDEEVMAHRSTEACSETLSVGMVLSSMRKPSELKETDGTTQHDSPGENAIFGGSRRLAAATGVTAIAIAHGSREACSETSSDSMVRSSMQKPSELQDIGDTTQPDSPGEVCLDNLSDKTKSFKENAICVESFLVAESIGVLVASPLEEDFVSLCMEMMPSMIISSIHSVRIIYRGKSIFPLARSTPRPSWVVPQHERRNMTEKDYEDWILRGEISDTEGKGNWKRREYEKYIMEDSPIHFSGGKSSDKERTGKVLHSRIFYQEAIGKRLEQTANKEQLRGSSCYSQGHASSIWKKILLHLYRTVMSGCAAEKHANGALFIMVRVGEEVVLSSLTSGWFPQKDRGLGVPSKLTSPQYMQVFTDSIQMSMSENRDMEENTMEKLRLILSCQSCNIQSTVWQELLNLKYCCAGKEKESDAEGRASSVLSKKQVTGEGELRYAEKSKLVVTCFFSILFVRLVYVLYLKYETREETAKRNKDKTKSADKHFEMESISAETVCSSNQEQGIRMNMFRDNSSSTAETRSLENGSEDLEDPIKKLPDCNITGDQTKGKEFCTLSLEHSNNPVFSSGQNDACDNIDPNESLTTDEATENINIDPNEDSSARETLFSCCQHLDIKENRSRENLLPIALTKDPEDGTIDDRDVIKVPSDCAMPSDNTQAKDFCTILFKDSIFSVTTCSQYERDDSSGILDGKEQSESLPTDGGREDCNRCSGHDNEINEVNDNMIVDNKHQKEDCLFTSIGIQKTAENQTEETDARVWEIIDRKDSGYNSLDDYDNSSDESLDANEIEDNVIERKESDKTVCDGVFGSQGLISQWEDIQISNEIEEFSEIGNRESDKTSSLCQDISIVLQDTKPDSGVILAEFSGFDGPHRDRNDQHLFRYKILEHKPVKSLKRSSKSLPVENLQIRDTQSREKLSCEKQKKDKYTYMQVLHHVSFLPGPNLDIAVFKNESAEIAVSKNVSAKFFEPVLDIVNLIADGNDPGPQVTMQYELLRICTLRNYPKDNKPFLIHFAKAGFYYAAEGDEVICYCCGLRRHSWLVTDVPYRIHQRINPNCKFLNRNSEFNVPVVYTGTTKNLDKLDKLLVWLEEENKSPQVTTEAEGGIDLSEYVPPQALSGGLNNPKHRQYVSKAQRLSSYEGWPDNLIQTPEIMAEAGFYYAGFGDCVRCYYCGIGLRHWTAEDNVWIEHARWSKHCAFLKQEKGQEFINLVHMAIKYTQDDDEQPVIAASNPDDKETPKNGESEQNLVEKILLTDPAQSVLEMGYTPKIIKKAIAFILNRDGRSGISSQTIMEKVLEFEEAETAKSLAGELANMDLSRQNNTSGGPDSGSSLKSNQKSKPSAGKTSKGLGDTSAKPGISCKDSRSKSIKEENEKLKGQTLCRVCTTNTVCIVLLPCGHLCACDECGSALRTCPMCNRDVKGTVKTYMS